MFWLHLCPTCSNHRFQIGGLVKARANSGPNSQVRRYDSYNKQVVSTKMKSSTFLLKPWSPWWFSTKNLQIAIWSHVKNGGEVYPSIHLSQRWRNCNLRNWRPWVLGKWNCAPFRGNWLELDDWPWVFVGWTGLEGRASCVFFLCIDVHRFVSKRLGLMSFVLFLKNSWQIHEWGGLAFSRMILKTLRWARQIQPHFPRIN